MAGKVLTGFDYGFAGTVARAADDVIESFVNKGTTAIAFGAPVVLATGGVKNFVPGTSAAADFVGVAVRIAKSNETYGADDAAYQANEITDIIKRGTVAVKLKSGVTAPALGGAVYVDASTGEFTTTSSGNVALTNCKYKGTVDTNGIVEMVILNRAL